MVDGATTVGALRTAVRRFVRERDWERFHLPKDLAIAISVEASELLERFLWRDPAPTATLSPEDRSAIAEELADVVIYGVSLADVLEVDLSQEVSAEATTDDARPPWGVRRSRWMWSNAIRGNAFRRKGTSNRAPLNVTRSFARAIAAGRSSRLSPWTKERFRVPSYTPTTVIASRPIESPVVSMSRNAIACRNSRHARQWSRGERPLAKYRCRPRCSASADRVSSSSIRCPSLRESRRGRRAAAQSY